MAPAPPDAAVDSSTVPQQVASSTPVPEVAQPSETTPSSSISFYLTAASGDDTIASGDPVVISVMIDVGTQDVRGVEVGLKYDPALISVDGLEVGGFLVEETADFYRSNRRPSKDRQSKRHYRIRRRKSGRLGSSGQTGGTFR